MEENEIIKLLIEKEKLKEDQIQLVLKEKTKSNAPLGYLLIRFGILSSEKWYNFVLRELKISPIDISQIKIEKEILNSLPEFTCRKYQVIPIFKGGGNLICGMVDPSDEKVIEELNKISSFKIEPRLVKEPQIRESLDKYFSQIGIEVISPIQKKEVSGKVFQPIGVKEVSESSAALVTEEIVSQAIELKATDIHIEIEEEGLRLRYRINGLLYEFPPPPLELYSSLISHIKVLANLDISEKRVPQDGYFKMKLPNREVDLRVSSFPTIFGEMLALRVLDKGNILSGLEQLGFYPETLHMWRMLLDEPYGQRVPVRDAFIRLHRRNDNLHQPKDVDEGDQDDRQSVDHQADLEVQRFLALVVHERILILLDEPDDQRPEYVAERYADVAGQCRQVRQHGVHPRLVAVLGRCLMLLSPHTSVSFLSRSAFMFRLYGGNPALTVNSASGSHPSSRDSPRIGTPGCSAADTAP